MMEELYLGVDGGQSHTEAVVGTRDGRVLGRGQGGPSNHAEQPGGRERLRRAIEDSVGSALRAAGAGSIGETEFIAVHCAMTGGADYKEEIIQAILSARRLQIAHDAPAALYGATGGQPGIVVIAGTGSVAYGENGRGEALSVGGWGYLFGDEGAGFWVAAEALRRAIRHFDGNGEATVLGELALRHFAIADLHKVARAFYNEEISRDRLASFARVVHCAAMDGDDVANAILDDGAESLARLATTAARRLKLQSGETQVACVGGMFRAELLRASFERKLSIELPEVRLITPKFDPAIGALLLAYALDGREYTDELLANLSKQHEQEGIL